MENRGEVLLKKNEERRVLAGHRWVFSNELQTPPETSGAPLLVDVRSASGRFLGTGLFNPHSLISVRLLDGPVRSLSAYLEEKIFRSVAMRHELGGSQEGVRLVHAEADGLPGLVVDRYGEYLSVQITTRALEAYSREILSQLTSILSPLGIRTDRRARIRASEGLPIEEDQIIGDIPPALSVCVDDVPLAFSLKEGQKTGLFLDQKDNVRALAPFLVRPRILDGFSYVGGWSAAIMAQGAKKGLSGTTLEITGVDASERAIGFYHDNVPGGRGIVSDFLPWGRKAREEGQRFDVVILDPPAFIKSRRLMKEGIEGYYGVFRLGLSLLAEKGVFVACSCSALLSWEDFSGILRSVFQKEGRRARLFYQGRASWDHPRILAMPELDYLKCAAFWVES